MVRDITELNFPQKDGKQYATLSHATATLADMGEKNITTQVKIDGEITPDFSYDWAVEFQGEKYIMPLRKPQGAKGNESLDSTVDLTFQHWAVYQLKRWPFVTIQPIQAGTYIADEEVADVELNITGFCALLGQVLEYYYGPTITVDLNPAGVYRREATKVAINHSYIWDVLLKLYETFGVRWEICPRSNNSNTAKGGERYVIKVGYGATEVDHVFEYGFEGGLLKVERQVQSPEIWNMIKGRGGSKNIPRRYFKQAETSNPNFRGDPDWVEELANIYFPNLMGATFRSYVQGWKAAHISKYPGYTPKGEANAYSPWAYRKGYTDTKFHPVEFVADEITISPAAGDRQVDVLPGFSPWVKKGSSLDEYGPLQATLDNDEDVYPTLQGTGMDVAVAVEQIESDDVAGATENDAQIEDATYPDIIKRNVAQGHKTAVDASKRTYFTVPTGKTAIIEGYAGAKAYNPKNHEDKSGLIAELDYTIKVFNAVTGAEHPASGIPAGDWYFTVEYSFNNTGTDALNVTLSFNSVKITSATPDDKWRKTFDIWVKNIWNSSKLATETDAQYAERVWKPVLGDREKNTAKVVFTSGALVHEDYEFTIVGFPVPDSSKTYEGQQSHWRITLAKSEAELEATGLYVPSTQKQGKAGDTFVFIGTEMTHEPYVVDAEERLDDWKKDQLGEVKEIKPTAVVTTDRVRLNNEGKPNALINQLRVGNSLRLFDKRFFNEEGKAYETLYLQSITYTYREPSSDDAALNPDVEIVLGNEYTTSANPVSMMQGEISALQKQLGSISNIEQIVRAVGDKLYLRKDGISDRSMSPTEFLSLLTSGNFRAGLIGGRGWGFYKDENGNWVLETDRVNVRQEMQVNNLVINQVSARGGMEVDTAAHMEVTRMVETATGYECYFDQKNGTVANLFHVGDVAYCNRWTPENATLKFYKRRVTAVAADHVTLTKPLDGAARPAGWPDSGVNGTGVPAEKDNIIHYGSYTDAERRYVKVRDVVGGGYERYIEGLDSVNATGTEYYFVGRRDGEKPRWFIGDRDSGYIEWKNGKLRLRGDFSAQSTIDGEGWFDRLHEEAPMQVSFDPPVLLFDGDESSAIAKTVYAYPVVRKGNEEYEMVPGKPGFDKHTLGFEISNDLQAGTAVTGLRVYGHNKKTEPTEFRPNLEIQVSKSLTQRSGTINLNVWIDGKAYPASLPWSLQLRGQAGVSAMSLLITNEMAGVGCTAAGVPTGPLPTTQVSVWQGAKQLTTGVSFAVSGTNCQATVSSVVNGVATVTPSAMSSNADTAEVEITATVGGVTLTGKMSLYKVRPGANGADGAAGQAAVVYSLEPSAQNITRTFDGEMSATKITFTQYRTTGNTPRVQASDHYIRVQRVGEDAGFGGGLKAASVEKAVTAKTMSIVAELYTAAGVVLDRVRVPIMADASTIEVGGANLLPWTNKGTRGWLTGVYHPTIPRDQWDARLGKMSLLPEPDGPGVRVELQVGSDNLGTLTAAKSTTYQVQFTVPAGVIQPGVRYMLSFRASGGTQSADIDVYVNRRGTGSVSVKYIGKIKAPDKAVNGTDAAGNCLDVVYHLPFITDNLTNYDPDAQMGITFYVKLAQDNYRWWYFEFTDMMLERGNVATSYKPHLNDTDYLTEAIRGATQMFGGLMLTSLIQLGSWDMSNPDNPRMKQVRAGINGLSSDSDYGQGMAIWAGGEMIDRGNPDIALSLAAAAASGDTGALVRAAMAAIRHDGTAYFCRNTVRLLQNRAEIGDNIVLDDEGVKLVKNGQIRLLITDTSVANFGQPGSSTVIPLALPALTLARNLDSTTGHVQVRGASGWSRIDLNGGNPLTDGSTLSVDITIDVDLGTGEGTYIEDFGLLLWIRNAATGNSITGGPGSFTFERINDKAVRLTEKFTKTFHAGSYYLQVEFSGNIGGTVNGNITPTVTSTGGLVLGVRDRTVLASDGLLTTWGNTTVLARAGRVLARVGTTKQAELDIFDGYATLRAGNYALRVSADNGFQKTIDYNNPSAWEPMF